MSVIIAQSSPDVIAAWLRANYPNDIQGDTFDSFRNYISNRILAADQTLTDCDKELAFLREWGGQGSTFRDLWTSFLRSRGYNGTPGDATRAFFSEATIIPNGNFEVAPATNVAQTASAWIDGTATGNAAQQPNHWRVGGSGSFSALFDAANPHSGKYSLKGSTSAAASYIELRDASGYTCANTSEGFPVVGGATYRVSCWMKTNYVSGDSGNGAGVYMLANDATPTDIQDSVIVPYVKTTTPWTFYTADVTVPATAVRAHIEPRIYGHTGTGTLIMDAWFDDIRVTRIA